MKKITLSFYLLLLLSAVQAQVSFGPKLGMNVSTESFAFSGYYNGNYVISRTPQLSYQAGVVLNLQVHNNFTIRPELLFNQVRTSTTFGDYYYDKTLINNTYNYITIPLNFVGTYYLGAGMLNLFIAPQLSIGVGGHYSQVSDSTAAGTGGLPSATSESGKLFPTQVPANGGGNSVNWYYNQVNVGFNYGVGYMINHCLFTAQYSLGLSSTQPYYSDPYSAAHRNDFYSRTNGFTFAMTYLFGNIKR